MTYRTSLAKTFMNICYGSFSGNPATNYGTQNYKNSISAITGTSIHEFTIGFNYYYPYRFSSSSFLSG